MPSYKTHSIHGEVILPNICNRVEINAEDLKKYCIGPDAVMITDPVVFEYQHRKKVKNYFETMLHLIKSNKLQDNSEVLAFLYGQLDHYVLDSTMHPLIYYMTENLPKKQKIDNHSLVEMWIDDYVKQKYGKDAIVYYKTAVIKDGRLGKLINKLYNKVYNTNNASLKYSVGSLLMVLFDTIVRNNLIAVVPHVEKMINTGDIVYTNDVERELPYLNLNHDYWFNPETHEKYTESFDDLWEKSINTSLETIEDVNNYLYKDKSLNNRLISNDISYNTGLSCSKGQKLKFLKRYKKNRI